MGRADELLADVERRGFRVRVLDGRLQIRNGDRLPDEVRRAVTAHRADLLVRVASREADAGAEPTDDEVALVLRAFPGAQAIEPLTVPSMRTTPSGRTEYTLSELQENLDVRLLSPGRLLRLLEDAGAAIEMQSTGIVVSVERPFHPCVAPYVIHAAAGRCGWLFRWALLGADAGHVWMVCSACEEPQLLAKRSEGRRCRMTAACPGTMKATSVFPTCRRKQGARRRPTRAEAAS